MERKILEQLVAEQASLREMAESFSVSISTICYWVKKYGIKRDAALTTRRLSSVSTEDLTAILRNSESIYEVLRRLRVNNIGANYGTLKARMVREGMVDAYAKVASDGRRIASTTGLIPLEEILKKDSPFSRGHIKKRLIKEGVLEEKCAVCDLGPEWQGRKLSLALDHINGDGRDNRLCNLRLLCPNCHSQTATFAGKNSKRHLKREFVGVLHGDSNNNAESQNTHPMPDGCVVVKVCKVCHKKFVPFEPSQQACSVACVAFSKRRVAYPEARELSQLVWSTPTRRIAQKFGVSEATVAKWCKKAGVAKPPVGYWAKRAPKSECPDVTEFKKMMETMPQKAVCRHYHINDRTFKRWCAKAKVTRLPYAHRAKKILCPVREQLHLL